MATSPLSTGVLPPADLDFDLVDLDLGPVERLEYGQNAADIAADNMAWITAEATAFQGNDDFDALLKDTVQKELDDGLLEPVLRDADAAAVSRKQQELDDELWGLDDCDTVGDIHSTIASAIFELPLPEPPTDADMDLLPTSDNPAPPPPPPSPPPMGEPLVAEGCSIFGPAPGVWHATFGLEQPNEHGHWRLVTHPVGKNVMYNKGAGVDQFTVDGLAGSPVSEGVTEKLELVVHQVNGARPTEKPKAGVQNGQRFLSSPIRRTALPLGDKNGTDRPQPGLNWWRIAGSPNQFHVIYGEQSKKAEGKMDKGIMRTATWCFQYSQVQLVNGEEVVLFKQTIPGTFFIRAGCSQVDENNSQLKKAMNLKKEALITLINQHGGPDPDYVAKLNAKRSREELLSLATEIGVSTAALAAATELTQEQVSSQVADYGRKKRRKCSR